jgi:hypothetical protein
VTASQTRAARSLLGWNLVVQISAIEGIEQEIHDASTLSAIKATFEKAGIIFVGSTGVRLKHDQEKGADAYGLASNVSARESSSCGRSASNDIAVACTPRGIVPREPVRCCRVKYT